jgi:hypothetical protein
LNVVASARRERFVVKIYDGGELIWVSGPYNRRAARVRAREMRARGYSARIRRYEGEAMDSQTEHGRTIHQDPDRAGEDERN